MPQSGHAQVGAGRFPVDAQGRGIAGFRWTAYLSLYGRDIGAFLANFRASFAQKTTDGKNVLALFAVANDQSVRWNPVNLGGGVLVGSNPYPALGQRAVQAPFSGPYPG